MTAVLIALADIGPAMPHEEQLIAAGVDAKWDAQLADGPRGSTDAMVVLVDADHLGTRLVEVTERWREQASVPGVIAIGGSAVAREQAPRARVTLLSSSARKETIFAAIKEAAKMRLASGMRWPVLRAASGLPPITESRQHWQQTLAAARAVDIEIPRSALRWHAAHYVTPTAKLDELREERVLTVPELEASRVIDGTRTVQSLVRMGPLDPLQTARMLWALGSMGALDFTPEIRDVTTGARRLISDLRAHLRARSERLEKSTFYDVLELTPLAEYEEIEAAYQSVASRFAPQVLDAHDLSELQALVRPMWELVEKARSVLVDHAQRGRYHDFLRQKIDTLHTVWAIDPSAVTAAAEAFVRGQRALGEGDVHKAMSDLAVACRHFPGHPDYEANFAWARYRVQVSSGRDRVEGAVHERKQIEELLVGRRPWPRALVPLALLCAAGNDADSARWHLHTALTIDPTIPAAAQLAQRLGMRRY
ncbi:MAG: hypothetical protein H0V17_10845 [Deltaproteobacteria bacterium]|nr:hypothetical protein [Deltaproteobacteria bacterium]